MLGGIKVGDAQPRTSLFRLLSRRWRPLARVKQGRPPLAFALGAEQEGTKSARAWVGTKRPRYAPTVVPAVNAKRSGSTWNPWLWTK